MSELEKMYQSIMSGTQDKNIKFKDLQKILNVLGFDYRVRGDHFIYFYKEIMLYKQISFSLCSYY